MKLISVLALGLIAFELSNAEAQGIRGQQQVQPQQSRRPAAMEPDMDESDEGTPSPGANRSTSPGAVPSPYRYSLGYESSTTGIMAQNYIVGGKWLSSNFGIDIYFGFTKSADTTATSVATSTNALTNARTITTTYSGSANPNVFTLAAFPKWKLFRNNWLFVFGGPFAGVNYLTKVEYPNGGNTVETIPNANDPTNKSVVDTSIGTTTIESRMHIVAGPRIGAEIFLKWFPQISVGMATGIATTIGADTKQKTSTRSRTYNVVNGVDQAPTADSNAVTETTTKPGISSSTFGLGGTQFNLFGNFTIRYYW
ncbi:MAG: hypothetical protein IT289_11140 [Oligoflexia bacterium]|nr:hypothetical protein [Oligoflexia bacterium]